MNYSARLLPDWKDIVEDDFVVERLSGAMTNCIFKVTAVDKSADSPVTRKALLRIYGHGVDQLLSRSKELFWLERLSQLSIGARLLGIFENGRIEEYLENTTLTKNDIREPKASRHIARRMYELHNLVKIYPPPRRLATSEYEVWNNIKNWHAIVKRTIKADKFSAEQLAKLNEFDFQNLDRSVELLMKACEATNSRLVFAHNDVCRLAIFVGAVPAGLDERGRPRRLPVRGVLPAVRDVRASHAADPGRASRSRCHTRRACSTSAGRASSSATVSVATYLGYGVNLPTYST